MDVLPSVGLGWSCPLIAVLVYFLIGSLAATGLSVVSQEGETFLEFAPEILDKDWIVHTLCPAQSLFHFSFLSGRGVVFCRGVIIGKIVALGWLEGLAHKESCCIMAINN